MNHEQWKARLDTYLDGELPSAEAQELHRHLRECSDCAAETVRRMQWKRAIKTAGERYVSTRRPPFTKRAQRNRSLGPASGFAAWALQPRAWWPAAAAALAAILLVAGLTINRDRVRETRNNQLIGELVDLHVATLASANPVDVVSTDRHTVKPWFTGKIPFTFDLPELKDTPFELIGGRVSYLDQSAGAELLVRVRNHQVSVFIFPAKSIPAGFNIVGLIDAKSFHLDTFEKRDLRYFVIGDVAVEDIGRLTERLKM